MHTLPNLTAYLTAPSGVPTGAAELALIAAGYAVETATETEDLDTDELVDAGAFDLDNLISADLVVELPGGVTWEAAMARGLRIPVITLDEALVGAAA